MQEPPEGLGHHPLQEDQVGRPKEARGREGRQAERSSKEELQELQVRAFHLQAAPPAALASLSIQEVLPSAARALEIRGVRREDLEEGLEVPARDLHPSAEDDGLVARGAAAGLAFHQQPPSAERLAEVPFLEEESAAAVVEAQLFLPLVSEAVLGRVPEAEHRPVVVGQAGLSLRLALLVPRPQAELCLWASAGELCRAALDEQATLRLQLPRVSRAEEAFPEPSACSPRPAGLGLEAASVLGLGLALEEASRLVREGLCPFQLHGEPLCLEGLFLRLLEAEFVLLAQVALCLCRLEGALFLLLGRHLSVLAALGPHRAALGPRQVALGHVPGEGVEQLPQHRRAAALVPVLAVSVDRGQAAARVHGQAAGDDHPCLYCFTPCPSVTTGSLLLRLPSTKRSSRFPFHLLVSP